MSGSESFLNRNILTANSVISLRSGFPVSVFWNEFTKYNPPRSLDRIGKLSKNSTTKKTKIKSNI